MLSLKVNMLLARLIITAALFFQGSRIVSVRCIGDDTLLVVTAEDGAWKGSSPEWLTNIHGTEDYFLTDGLKFSSGYIFATCGSGLLFVRENSNERWGFSTMGPQRQYCSSLIIFGNKLFAGFSDGLCEIFENSPAEIEFFTDGKFSYTIDLVSDGKHMAVSNMSGVFILSSSGIKDLLFPDSFSHNKTVAFLSDTIAIGTDSGLWIFDGKSWIFIDESFYINCFFLDSSYVYCGTHEGLEIFDRRTLDKIIAYKTYPVLSIQKFKGRWLFGTAEGLFADSLGSMTDANCFPANIFKEYPHPFIDFPFPAGYNNLPDQTYLYSSTFGGNLRVHKGLDYNNPGETPVVAGADGIVVSSGTSGNGANFITVRYFVHQNEHGAVFLYTHFSRHSPLKPGEVFKSGDTIGFVGHTGRATNDHLHLETRIITNAGTFSVNPSVWLRPIPGTGALAGTITRNGEPLEGAKIYGIFKPWFNETPFIFAETYSGGSESDPEIKENFFIDAVCPGFYSVRIISGNMMLDSFTVEIKQDSISWVERDVDR